jgi:hypothetical protein
MFLAPNTVISKGKKHMCPFVLKIYFQTFQNVNVFTPFLKYKKQVISSKAFSSRTITMLKPCQLKRMNCETRIKNLMMCHKNAKNLDIEISLGGNDSRKRLGMYIIFIICIVVMCLKRTFFLHLN